MALVDQSDLEYYLDVPAAIATTLLLHRFKSELYLRDLKGHTWYDQMEDWNNSGTLTLTQTVKLNGAKEAESYLCYYFGLPHLNLRLDSEGAIVVAEWEDDGAGVKTQRVFASMRQLNRYREELLWQVKWIVGNIKLTGYSLEGYGDLITGIDVPNMPPVSGIPPRDDDPTRCDVPGWMPPDPLSDCQPEGEPENDDRYGTPDDPADDPETDTTLFTPTHVYAAVYAGTSTEIVIGRMAVPDPVWAASPWEEIATLTDTLGGAGSTNNDHDLVFDANVGYAFIAHGAGQRIIRYNLPEFENAVTIATSGLQPYGCQLAINLADQKLMFIQNTAVIETDYDGTNSRTIYDNSGAPEPVTIAFSPQERILYMGTNSLVAGKRFISVDYDASNQDETDATTFAGITDNYYTLDYMKGLGTQGALILCKAGGTAVAAKKYDILTGAFSTFETTIQNYDGRPCPDQYNEVVFMHELNATQIKRVPYTGGAMVDAGTPVDDATDGITGAVAIKAMATIDLTAETSPQGP